MPSTGRIAAFAIAISLLAAGGCAAPNSKPAGRSPSALPRPQPYDAARPTTGCGRPAPATAGTTAALEVATDSHLERGRSKRDYLLHLPAGYSEGQPVPLVVVLHGYSGDAAAMEQATGLSLAADRLRFAVAYPEGVTDSEGNQFWNSVGNVGKSPDDVLFVSLLLDQLQRSTCIDAARIYATGFSNGGGMTGVLVCRLAHRIAAFAPIAGNFYRILDGCMVDRPVSLLEIHGSRDDVIPYGGIPPSQEPQYPLPAIPDWLAGWALHDSCSADPTVFLSAPDVLGERWSGCAAGSEVAHYRIEGGGHSVPAQIGGRPFADVLWDFFSTHVLST